MRRETGSGLAPGRQGCGPKRKVLISMLNRKNAIRCLAGVILLTVGVVGVRPILSAEKDVYQKLDLFLDVLERVRTDFVDKPDDWKLIEAALNGMLSSLDPHSGYIGAQSLKKIKDLEKEGKGGFGVEITQKQGLVRVITPIEGSPADLAGIQPGDVITQLDGESLSGLILPKVRQMMRGPIGKEGTLTLVREGRGEPFEAKMARRDIDEIVVSVQSRIADNVGYVRITAFNSKTADHLRKAIEDLKKDIGPDLKGFVIDLRNNPGGLIDQTIAVADALMEKGDIVKQIGRKADTTNTVSATAGDVTDGKPLVVLVNGGTYGSGEIIAGALQENERATILGSRSFGGGSVQTIIPLGTSGAIKLTTARYVTPKGRSITADGIKPDVNIEQRVPKPEKTDTDTERQPSTTFVSPIHGYVPDDPKKDLQLHSAFKLARGDTTVAQLNEAEKAKEAAAKKKAEAKKAEKDKDEPKKE